MRVVNRQALVPYTPAQMYALVNGIARYPEFVPWCPETVDKPNHAHGAG